MTRHYVEHMIRLNIPLNREWTGDVHAFCEVDGIIYPHLILECVSKYKNTHLVEMCVNNIQNRLTIIEDAETFQKELERSQFDLQCQLMDLKQYEPKKMCYRDIEYSKTRTQELVKKLNSGKNMSEGDFSYLIRHGHAFAWKFRGNKQQYEKACNVRFTCVELGCY